MITMDLQELSEEARMLIAAETSSSEVLGELSEDLSSEVKLAAAGNIHTNVCDLERLAEDENTFISRVANKTLEKKFLS